MREKVEALLQPEDLSRYAIRGDAEFEEALSKGGKLPKSGYLSVKSKGPANGLAAKASDAREGKRKDKDRKEGKKPKKAKG